MVADPLFSNPAAYFGNAVNHLVLQAYVRVANGAVYLNGLKVAAGPGVSGKTGADGVAIVSLERKADGNFTAVGLRYTEHPGRTQGGIRDPGGNVRTTAVPPPQARRSAAAVASLIGSNGTMSSGSQSMVANAGPLITPSASGSAAGNIATTSTAASAPVASITTPVVTMPTVTTAPVTTVPVITAPVITAPVMTAPVITAPVMTAPVTTPPVTAPVGIGAAVESIPTSPSTSQLMSSNTSKGTGITTALQASGVTRTATAVPAASTAGSLASSTVSLATQAVTTAATSTPKVTTPAVLAPAASSPSGIKAIGTGLRNATSTGALRSH